MFIRTERLFLRPCWPEDAKELLDVFSDDAEARKVAAIPMFNKANVAESRLSQARDTLLPPLSIYLRSDAGSRLVGTIGLCRNGDDVELGYWIARPYRGHGYAGEAVQAVLRQARALGHKRIVAFQSAESAASATVLKDIGFRETGALRSCYRDGRPAEAPARVLVANLETMPQGMALA
ncbi:GNAT family N-acetyltransferase [Novosphingobium aquimarinum]|uniref:GNAT family N-acetyltransferase n=1 Tax=Novosphingobium aquimarinum TaxID=2682494 RepID=UPI0012EC7358|nr:GNAT family N-acetyltransferase [Novosphingobium aquimarinum]